MWVFTSKFLANFFFILRYSLTVKPIFFKTAFLSIQGFDALQQNTRQRVSTSGKSPHIDLSSQSFFFTNFTFLENFSNKRSVFFFLPFSARKIQLSINFKFLAFLASIAYSPMCIVHLVFPLPMSIYASLHYCPYLVRGFQP